MKIPGDCILKVKSWSVGTTGNRVLTGDAMGLGFGSGEGIWKLTFSTFTIANFTRFGVLESSILDIETSDCATTTSSAGSVASNGSGVGLLRFGGVVDISSGATASSAGSAELSGSGVGLLRFVGVVDISNM